MPEQDEDSPWNQLVGAAKEVGATAPDGPPEPVPSGFAGRIVAMREGLWRLARTLLWRRWSLVAALLAIVLYLILYFVLKSDPVPEPAPQLPMPPAP